MCHRWPDSMGTLTVHSQKPARSTINELWDDTNSVQSVACGWNRLDNARMAGALGAAYGPATRLQGLLDDLGLCCVPQFTGPREWPRSPRLGSQVFQGDSEWCFADIFASLGTYYIKVSEPLVHKRSGGVAWWGCVNAQEPSDGNEYYCNEARGLHIVF